MRITGFADPGSSMRIKSLLRITTVAFALFFISLLYARSLYVISDNAVVYSSPSTSSEVITTVPRGTEVVLYKERIKWIHVIAGDYTGWVRASELSEKADGEPLGSIKRERIRPLKTVPAAKHSIEQKDESGESSGNGQETENGGQDDSNDDSMQEDGADSVKLQEVNPEGPPGQEK